jgi:MoxR-like ATPase
VVSKEELLLAQDSIKKVAVSSDVREYILNLVESTRNHADIQLGVSTRGAIALMKASQGVASIRNRDFVCPEDVLYIFESVVAHRIILKRNVSTSKENVLKSVVESIAVPR